MFNFRFNITDYLNEIPSNILIIGIFFLVVVLLGLIALYIISSLGIMIAAKKNNIPSPWLAFIPYGRYYIIGKLGFEVYSEESKKHPELTWVLFGLSAATLVLGSRYGTVLGIAITVFNAMAFYNMYKVLVPKNATMFMVFTVIVENLGGVFLYSLRDKIEIIEIPEVKAPENVVEEEKIEPKKEVKEEKERPKFCPNCGTKLTKTAKYCPECGKEIK